MGHLLVHTDPLKRGPSHNLICVMTINDCWEFNIHSEVLKFMKLFMLLYILHGYSDNIASLIST